MISCSRWNPLLLHCTQGVTNALCKVFSLRMTSCYKHGVNGYAQLWSTFIVSTSINCWHFFLRVVDKSLSMTNVQFPLLSKGSTIPSCPFSTRLWCTRLCPGAPLQNCYKWWWSLEAHLQCSSTTCCTMPSAGSQCHSESPSAWCKHTVSRNMHSNLQMGIVLLLLLVNGSTCMYNVFDDNV